MEHNNNYELYHYGVKGMKWGVIRKRVTDRVNAYRKAHDIDSETRAKIRDMQAKRRNEEIVKRAKAKAAARVKTAKQDLDRKYPDPKKVEEARKAEVAKKAEEAKQRAEEAKQKADAAKKTFEENKQKAEEEAKAKAASKPKTMAEMNDDELRKAIARIQLENQYKGLIPEKKSILKKGVETVGKYSGKVVDQVLVPVALDTGKKYLTKSVNSALGLETKSDYDTLKKTYDTLKIKKDIKDIKSQLTDKGDDELVKLRTQNEKSRLAKEIADNEKNKLAYEKQAYYLNQEKEKGYPEIDDKELNKIINEANNSAKRKKNN